MDPQLFGCYPRYVGLKNDDPKKHQLSVAPQNGGMKNIPQLHDLVLYRFNKKKQILRVFETLNAYKPFAPVVKGCKGVICCVIP